MSPFGVDIVVVNENLLPSILPSLISPGGGSISPNFMENLPVSLSPSDFSSNVWTMVKDCPSRSILRSETHLPSMGPARAEAASNRALAARERNRFITTPGRTGQCVSCHRRVYRIGGLDRDQGQAFEVIEVAI